ncbi:MAG: DUF4384 domain-containing protein [Bryobacteraceae bacterium]
MSSRAAVALWVAAAACAAGADRVDVRLERRTGEEWRGIDSKTVLEGGDRIRFRVRCTMPGWLYVYSTDSSGKAGWLVEDGLLIVKDQDYEIPRGAAYTVSGPAGFDVVYWIVSPRKVPAEALVPANARRNVSNTMRPRCREGSGEAKMACLDDRAGASGLRARELKEERGTEKGGEGDRNFSVMVSEFRVAHR